MDAPADRGRRLSVAKKLLFTTVVFAGFFVLLEGSLALLGIHPVTADSDPYVGFQSYFPLFRATADGRYETAPNKLQLFNRQAFPERKGGKAVRIFTVGGSTTYGRPFDDTTSFTGWLRTYLGAAAPGVDWQVVNAGGISYASYRVAKLLEELVEYEPDVVIVYTGNNEFLERRTYSRLFAEPKAVTGTKLVLQRSRTWALGRHLAEWRRHRAEQTYQMTGEVQELLDTSAGLDLYHRDDAFREQVLDHFRYNLERMVQLARGAGAKVIFVTVPVNLRSFAPFKSEHGEELSAAQRQRCGELQATARRALTAGDPDAALSAATEAVELDPRDADDHFVLGQVLTALGRNEEAGTELRRAVIEDVCPLRALPSINRAIRDTAQRDAVALVDFEAVLEDRTETTLGHRNPGDEVFMDHVHPTVRTHGLLGRALLDQLAAMDVAPRSIAEGSQADLAVRREVEGKVDQQAYARAYKNLSKVLLWAGKKEEAERYLELAKVDGDEDWEISYNEGVLALEAGDAESARASLEEARRLAPTMARVHDQLSMAYAATGDLDHALEASREALRLDPETAGAWSNRSSIERERGDAGAALEAAQRAIEIEPDLAAAHNNLGNALFDLGRIEPARQSYARALELRPGFADARVNLGLVLGQRGEYEAALTAFDAALEADPDRGGALLGRAKAQLALGRIEPAVASLERAVAAVPQNPESWELLARSLVSAGRPRDSDEVLRRAMAAFPDEPRWPHLLGRNLADRGEYPPAEKAFQRALELDPAYLGARIDLGNLYTVENRPEEAAATYRTALEHSGESSPLEHSLAAVLIMSGDVEGGLHHLERAVEIDPENGQALQDLAAVYAHLGRSLDAKSALERAAELDPELRPVQRAAGGPSDGGGAT